MNYGYQWLPRDITHLDSQGPLNLSASSKSKKHWEQLQLLTQTRHVEEVPGSKQAVTHGSPPHSQSGRPESSLPKRLGLRQSALNGLHKTDERTPKKNIQQLGFAGGHPPNY
ncbi:hypothetical protein KEM54_000141 [Ascosphaera aggregata]|nr:hypothetical protein KEM54_000141 [Ascosphaera aggregata]